MISVHPSHVPIFEFKRVDEVSGEEIREAPEDLVLVVHVQQQRRPQVRHALDVPDVWSVAHERLQHLPQRLVH